jgi:O-antigen ligase
MRFGLCCLFIALYILRPFEFLPSLYGFPILLTCGVLGLLTVLFAFINNQAQWYETDTLMVGFFLAVLLSHANHLYFSGTLSAFQKFLPIFLGYFLVAHSITTQKQLVVFLYVFTFSVCIVAVEGCFEYYKGVSYFGIEPLLQKYYTDGVQLSQVRIKWLGPFSDPNDLALLFVIPIPFLIARCKQSKLVSLAASTLLILGIFYTNSRGGVLSLIVAIAGYYVLRYRNKTGLALGVCLGVCLLLVGPSRMGQMSAGEDSAYGRLEAWYEGFQMFKQSPFFGVGMDMFTDFHELTAHNSFVLVMAELGMFGLFFFTGLFWVPLKKMKFFLWGEGRNSLPTEDIALFSALAASLAAVMTAMFFLSRSYILIPYILIALIVRLLCFYNSELIDIYPSGKTLKEVVLCTVMGVIFINIFIKVLL